MNILSLRGQGSLTANLLQHPRYRVVGSAIEPLEDRIALATLLWDGSAGDGDWFNAQNWDQNAVPGTGDSAILAISSTINLTTEATVGSFQQTAGTLTGVGNLEILGDLAWSGGTMAGTGTTSVAGLSSSISGIDAKILGRTVNQTGTITYSSGDSSGQLLIGTGPTSGVLNNSGTFNVTSGGDFLVDVASAGNAINNSGAWNVSGAGTTSNVIGIPFNNSGSVSVNSSTLALLAGSSGNTTGDFSVASGATVRLGGNFSLAATVDFTGVGSVSFQSGSNTVLGTYNTGASIFSGGNVTFNVPLTTLGAGTSSFTGGTVTFNMPVGSLGSGGLTISGSTVNFNATIPAVVSGALTISSGAANFNSNDISAAAINLSGGTLGGSASMSTSGDLTWTGGTMAGTGTTSVAGLSSSISGIDAKILGRTLNQTGTMTYSSGDSSGQVLLGTGPTSGVLNNSGTFNVTSGGDFLVDVASAGNAINNSGTWNVSGAGTTSNVTGIPFNNSASVNISSGTFALQGGFIQTAGITTLAGGALSTGATLDFQGGMLAGSGTITGNVNNSGGTVRPGGTGTAGTLTITGTYTQGASGTLSVEVGGTGAGQFDALSVGGTATLGGTLSATLIDGFVPQDGARFQVLTASPRSGGFAPTNLPSGFTAENNANDVTLVASVSAVFTWDGSDSSDWFDADNWTPAGVPAATDTAILDVNSTINLALATSVGAFNQSAGTFTGAGAFTILGDLTWTGGTMTGTGTTSVAGAASTISGGAQKGLDRTLTNTGTITFSIPDNSGAIIFGLNTLTPGALNNSGTFNVTAGGDFSQNVSNAAHAINNSGTWNVMGAGTTSTIGAGVAFNNTGAVNVSDGAVLALNGGGTSTGSFAISSGTTLEFGGGTHNLNAGSALSGAGTVEFGGGTGNFNAGSYNLTGMTSIRGGSANFNAAATTVLLNLSSGTLDGSAMLSVTGDLTWTGGTMTGTGTTSVAGAASTISGGAQKGLDRTLTNTGTITFSIPDNSGAIVFGLNTLTPGALNNSGTFNVTAGGDFSQNVSNAAHAINNSGTWNVMGAGTTSTIGAGVAFNNTGAVNVSDGAVLALNGGGTSTGSFAISSGTTLEFGGGTHNLNAGSALSGAGTVEFGGGTGNFNAGSYNLTGMTSIRGGSANFNAAATTVLLNLSSGTLDGSAMLSVTGDLTWTGGTMTGTGTTSVAGAASTISGGAQKGLDRTLTNTGTITFSIPDNSGAIIFGLNTLTPGALNNSGTFNVTAGGDFSQNVSNAAHAINNSGTWNVMGAGTTSTIGAGVAFNNTGAVNVSDGAVLALNGGGTSTGSFAISSGTTLEFGGGTHNLNAGSALSGAGTVEFGGGTGNFNAGSYNLTGMTSIRGGSANFNAAATTVLLNLSSGTLDGSAMLSVTGDLTWTGGTMTGTGTTSVAGAASTISGGAQKGLDRTLTNTGTITFSIPDNSGAIIFGLNTLTPGALNNSGTFNVTAGGDFSQNVSNAAHAINNSGTWNVMGAGTTSTIGAGVAFNNTGAVNVSDGAVLALNGGGTSTGSFAISSGTTLEFGGGTHNLNAGSALSGAGTVEFGGGTGNFNAGSYNLTGMTSIRGGSANFNAAATTVLLNLSSGTLDGSAMLSVTGDLTWTGGTMTGTGTTSVAGAASTISGGAQKGLDRTLTNTGTITFSIPDNSGAIVFGLNTLTPGALNNSGTFNVTAGGDFSQNVSNAAHAINNSGTWNVMGAGTTSTIGAGVAFNNTGAVNVSDGAVLALNGGGTSTGSFAISSGTTLEFGGGTHNLNAGSALSGAGTVEFGGGTGNFNAGSYNLTGMTSIRGGSANFNAAATTVLLNLSSGTLDGSAMLSVTGDLTWTGGTMTGTGTTSVAGAASTISGGAQKGLDRTLTNTGTITFSIPDNSGAIIFGLNTLTPGALNNSGTFNVTAGGDFSQNVSNAAHAINNSGTWNVMGAGTTSTTGAGVAFNNTGAVNVASGTLSLQGSFTQTAGSTLLEGGALSTGTTMNLQGGTLAGSGTITGNVHNSGGIVQPGGTGAAGTLAITDTYAQTGSGVLTAELGGTGSGQFDTLLVGEIATLGGTLGAALINGFAPAAGDVFNVVVAATRSGTFSTLNAPGSLALEYTATQAQLVFAGALPLLSINDASVIESASGTVIVSFNIRLSAPSSQPVTVQYATADGTATASEDYGAVSLTTVTFAPGEILKTVDVAVSGDTLAESLEVFAINLSNPTNATLLDPIGQGAIIEFAISGAGKSATFVEVDGDRVTFEVSGGALSASNFVFSAEGTLQKIDLTQGNFSGANITARAQQNGGGDGLLNVGAIDATGLTLGKVRVTGDLGQIDVGDGSGKALKALTVGSLGALGATTQAAGTLNPLLSEIRGILPKLTVQRDVMNAIVEVSDKLGKVRIGGSLIDSGAPAPTARAAGSIGVFLNGGVPPVGASRAGTLFAPNIGPVTIAGDINGGEITAEEEIKSVKIVGRLVSLDPLDPAVLRAGTAIDKIIINDDVQNALILAGYNRSLQPRNPDASIGKVVVNGDWTASSVVAGVADPTDNGFGIGDQLVAGDTTPALLSRIASVIIKGTATGSATATDHSAITAQTIGTLRIAGAKLPLTSGANNILLDPLQQNFRAVEL